MSGPQSVPSVVAREAPDLRAVPTELACDAGEVDLMFHDRRDELAILWRQRRRSDEHRRRLERFGLTYGQRQMADVDACSGDGGRTLESAHSVSPLPPRISRTVELDFAGGR